MGLVAWKAEGDGESKKVLFERQFYWRCSQSILKKDGVVWTL